MKAVVYPFRRDDAIVGLVQDFPDLQWTGWKGEKDDGKTYELQ